MVVPCQDSPISAEHRLLHALHLINNERFKRAFTKKVTRMKKREPPPGGDYVLLLMTLFWRSFFVSAFQSCRPGCLEVSQIPHIGEPMLLLSLKLTLLNRFKRKVRSNVSATQFRILRLPFLPWTCSKSSALPRNWEDDVLFSDCD